MQGGLTRRVWLASAAMLMAAGTQRAASSPGRQDRPGERLSPWKPGGLDIHVISTGRGDCTLVVLPDGRTLMIDVGAASGDPAGMLPARPDARQRPGQHIAAYLRRRLAETGGSGLDILYLTHLHDDHVSGVHDLAGETDIRLLIDPDFPDYGYPPFEGRTAMERYVAFAEARAASGGAVRKLDLGPSGQFGAGPARVTALASRGQVWAGEDQPLQQRFPDRSALSPEDYPNENASGSAILLEYGAFRAFFGGDLNCWADAGARPWLDLLTPAAEAAGPVTFALAPHHGLYTGSGAAMVQALQPEIWAISAWHRTHPSPSTLARLLEPRLNPRLKGVYLTGISPVAAAMSERLLPRLASLSGNIIVRVSEGGRACQVLVTDDECMNDTVLSASALYGAAQP